MYIRLAVSAMLAAAAASGQPLTGLWDGVLHAKGADVPFRFEIEERDGNVQGSFFNGDERVTSTGGRLAGNSLLLNFSHYATRLEATVEDGRIKGTYGNPARTVNGFEAVRHAAAARMGEAPDIAGVWEIPTESPKGERAWRLIVRQSGAEVAAAILRVDGDTGALTGSYQDGKFLLSHFSGARPLVLEVAPREGALELTLRNAQGAKTLGAIRPTTARAERLPEPTDPSRHTRMKDPDEPFRFSFPDLEGRLVSNGDARFKGKVLLVNVTGSWCPNCHDEAPFLEALYRKYRALGLEIVALDFEETEQLKDPSRLRAFLRNYAIDYTYLLAGEPDQLAEKVPQAENLNSWPTTFFVGRDGKVKAIHAGFAAKASGEFHTKLEHEVTETVERLISENVQASR